MERWEEVKRGLHHETICVAACMQRPLSRRVLKRSQDQWIIVEFGNEGPKELIVCTLTNLVPRYQVITDLPKWKTWWTWLADLLLADRKWWMIGFGMRALLDRSKWIKRLNDGDLALPTRATKGGKHKRSGKLTMTPSCLDVDLVVGQHKIKLIDWENYGLDGRVYLEAAKQEDCSSSFMAFQDWLRFVKLHGLPTAKTTIAQVGWSKAKQTLKRQIVSVNQDEQARRLERRAYFGGRNEAFRLGKMPGLTHCVDINGCYTQVCCANKLPYHMTSTYPLGMQPDDPRLNSGNHFIADVILNTKEASYPLDLRGATVYPTGRFKTTMCWPELEHALTRGRVERIIYAQEYLAAPILRSFATWYIDAKAGLADASLPRLKSAIKAAYNRALGFTARLEREWLPWSNGMGYDFWLGYTPSPECSEESVRARIVRKHGEWLRVGGEPREAMPFLHATICSWARVMLAQIIAWAGPGNVYYCDTDGVLVSPAGLDNLKDVPDLCGVNVGQLSERCEPGRAVIRGQKNYRIGSKVVCSGLPSYRRNEWDTTGAAARMRHWSDLAGEHEDGPCKVSITTSTGRVDSHGVVTPFAFDCEDKGDQVDRWINVETGAS